MAVPPKAGSSCRIGLSGGGVKLRTPTANAVWIQKCARRGSNAQPSATEADALSSCATGAAAERDYNWRGSNHNNVSDPCVPPVSAEIERPLL